MTNASVAAQADAVKDPVLAAPETLGIRRQIPWPVSLQDLLPPLINSLRSLSKREGARVERCQRANMNFTNN